MVVYTFFSFPCLEGVCIATWNAAAVSCSVSTIASATHNALQTVLQLQTVCLADTVQTLFPGILRITLLLAAVVLRASAAASLATTAASGEGPVISDWNWKLSLFI